METTFRVLGKHWFFSNEEVLFVGYEGDIEGLFCAVIWRDKILYQSLNFNAAAHVFLQYTMGLCDAGAYDYD